MAGAPPSRSAPAAKASAKTARLVAPATPVTGTLQLATIWISTSQRLSNGENPFHSSVADSSLALYAFPTENEHRYLVFRNAIFRSGSLAVHHPAEVIRGYALGRAAGPGVHAALLSVVAVWRRRDLTFCAGQRTTQR
jgi:hypothetical protein